MNGNETPTFASDRDPVDSPKHPLISAAGGRDCRFAFVASKFERVFTPSARAPGVRNPMNSPHRPRHSSPRHDDAWRKERRQDLATPAGSRPDSLQAAIDFLYDRINYERTVPEGPEAFRLQRMRELVRQLGNGPCLFPKQAADGAADCRASDDLPDRPLTVHIAGTKGKGSVATMVAAILTGGGLRTGLYTSPHLETIHGRFRIDGQPCRDADLIDITRHLAVASESLSSPPSFFEMTTAGSFDWFCRMGCEAIVLEVGLGGRLDSTNVYQTDVTAITTIGLDHQNILGKTHRAIAAEKAGIIKPGVPIVSGVQNVDADAVIVEIANRTEAPLFRLGHDFVVESRPASRWGTAVRYRSDHPVIGADISFDLSLEGKHQAENAAVAIAMARLVDPKLDPDRMSWSLRHAGPPARMERFRDPRGVHVVLDVAHNIDSARVLADAIGRRCEAQRTTLLFATSKDKNAAEVLAALTPHCDRLLLTRFQGNPRWYDPRALQALVPEEFRGRVEVFDKADAALNHARAHSDDGDWVVIAGSFFLAAELRPQLCRFDASRHSDSNRSTLQ